MQPPRRDTEHAETVQSDMATALAASPLVLAPGDRVGHYEVRRRIGSGGMGDVYLARDLTLGRRVALKLVRSDQRLTEAMLERFLIEARATARFNHPNIVSIYGVGEHAGVPYVALEYVRGESLRDRLRNERLGVKDALRITSQIAEALAEAHDYGVLHCDLKPENVIIARDGRVRVLDFGLAIFVGGIDQDAPSSVTLAGESSPGRSSEASSGGTPEYMAPEQWLGEPLSGGTDIWALGAMLHELCTGRMLFAGKSLRAIALAVADFSPEQLEGSSELPEPVLRLLGDCLAPDPERRPRAREVAQRIKEHLHGSTRPDPESSPYRGLLPFDERDENLFFGREAVVNTLADRARRETVLPVVGPSGAGKSSLVLAGLIPRLREHQRWLILRLRPTTDPFRALAGRLFRAESRASRRSEATADEDGRSVAELRAMLFDSPRRLGWELERLAERQSTNVLLFVDQLEELYTHGHPEVLCERFVEAVGSAAGDPDVPVRVVFTLRGDFLDRLAAVPEARDALAQVTVLHRPSRRELRDILVRPLEMVGYRFDDASLPDAMIEAAGGEPACLPLLQFAAQKLWEDRDPERRLVHRETYERMGGIEGALAGHAEGVLSGMSLAERRIARQLLLRLVTPRQTRRVVAKNEALRDLPAEGERVLARLTEARLVTVAGADAATSKGHSQVELAHESLIHIWKQLALWIEETKDERSFLADIDQASELWDKRGRRTSELWQDEALGEALRTLQRLDLTLPERARSFLDAATKRQRRRTRRKRVLIAGAVLVSLGLAVIFGLQSDRERRAREHADEQRQLADQKRAESLREAARAALGQGAVLEARAKVRESLELGDDLGSRMLWWQLGRQALAWEQQAGTGIYGVSFASAHAALVAAGQDGALYVFDVATSQRRVLRGGNDQTLALDTSPDGRMVVSGHANGEAFVWSLDDGSRRLGISGFKGAVRALAVDSKGRRVVIGSADGEVRAAALPGGETLWRKQLPGLEVQSAVWVNDDTVTLVDAVGGLSFLDAASGRERRRIETGMAPARSLAVSRDGRWLALGGTKGVEVRSLDDERVERRLAGHGQVYGIAFHPHEDILATSTYDRAIVLFDMANGRTLTRIENAHASEVQNVAFDATGELLASSARDGSVRLWTVARLMRQTPSWAHRGAIYRVAFAPGRRRLASVGVDKTLRIWDREKGLIERSIALDSRSNGVAFSPDGARLATGSGSTAQVWDVDTGAELARLLGHSGEVWDVEFDPAGESLLTAGEDGTVRVWQLGPNRLLRTLEGHRADVYRAAFSRDGARVASASRDRTVRLWQTATGRTLGVYTFPDRVYGVGFLAENDALAVAGFDRALERISPRGSERLAPLLERAWDLDVREPWIGVATTNSKVFLWHLERGAPTQLTGHQGEVNSLRFDGAGAELVTGSDDGTLRLWRLEDGSQAWRAPALLPSPARLFSHRGWERLSKTDAEESVAAGLMPRLRAKLEQEAAHATTSDGSRLCLLTPNGRAELWNVADDRLLRAVEPSVRSIVATSDACLALSEQGAVWITEGEAPRVLVVGATAVGAYGKRLAIVAPEQLYLFDERGEERHRRAIAPGLVVAVVPIGEGAAIGRAEGSVEILDHGADPRQLENVPSSPPTAMMPGPADTLVVGFATGVVGLWSARDGRSLAREQLHGPVVHLLREGAVAMAASELGAHVSWDLQLLERDRCEVLHEVWRDVPVVWEDGGPIVRPSPADHPCARTHARQATGAAATPP